MAYPKDIITEVLFKEDDIKQMAKDLGAQITKDYEGKDPPSRSVYTHRTICELTLECMLF